MRLFYVIFRNIVFKNVLKIHERKQQLLARHIGQVPIILHGFTIENLELCRTSNHLETILKPKKISKQIQHLRELLLKLTHTFQLPFVNEELCKIGHWSLTKQNIPHYN
jgi:hypothetical protein